MGDGITASQIARFAKVLAAACQDINIKVLTPELPSWMSYLMGDAFAKTYDNSRDTKLEHRKHWHFDLLTEIIAKKLINRLTLFYIFSTVIIYPIIIMIT